jgi:hypothetical protein
MHEVLLSRQAERAGFGLESTESSTRSTTMPMKCASCGCDIVERPTDRPVNGPAGTEAGRFVWTIPAGRLGELQTAVACNVLEVFVRGQQQAVVLDGGGCDLAVGRRHSDPFRTTVPMELGGRDVAAASKGKE